jgi:pimeloyl-ACP methyl ester carboxylesterase
LNDGRQIIWGDYGDPAGQPVIVFHGMPGSHLAGALFYDLGKAKGLRFISPARPGYSRSTPHNRSMITTYPDDIA